MMRGVLLDVIYGVLWKGDILVENCIKEKGAIFWENDFPDRTGGNSKEASAWVE